MADAKTSAETQVAASSGDLVRISQAQGTSPETYQSKATDIKYLGGGRESLTAARTYYVDGGSGSDSNDGLSPGAGAFATLQKAMDVISANLDLGPYDVTVSVADGTYAAGLSFSSYRATSGSVTFQGNTSTPANCVISTSGICITNASGAVGKFTLNGFKLTSSGNSGINIGGVGMNFYFLNIDFGACTSGAHIISQNGAVVAATGNYAITGGASQHYNAGYGGLLQVSGVTVTLTGTPAFSYRTAYASNAGIMRLNGNTYSGSATGVRYLAEVNAVIYVGGAGATYLPGNSAGSTATGGQYV